MTKPAALRVLLLAILALVGWFIFEQMTPQEKPAGEGPSENADRGAGPANNGKPGDTPREKGSNRDVESFVAMAKNASIDADERERRIMEQGRTGGRPAARALMALGDEDTYLNFAAINALAGIKDPEVEAYLVGKLNHGDPRMIAAAAASLATIQGTAAVAAITATLQDNRVRADGQHDLVCAACVEALKRIGHPSALPALAEELDQTVGFSLSYDYGSRIVSVIREIGDPAGIPILQSYADRLDELKSDNSDNPQAEHFFQSEIEKATEAINHLGQGRDE